MAASNDTLLQEFTAFVRERNLINHGDRIIVSVSGGVDSVVLLDVLHNLQKEWGLELAVAHFNHQLRGNESDEDEAFVKKLSENLGLDCYIERANTKLISETRKLSLQETARELRYTFWTHLRQSLGFHSIATAHHADDNAETLLFNLVRGTGIHGMSGIPSVRKDLHIIRPLLFVTRNRLRSYAEKYQLKFREDSSNLNDDYTRNFLRNQVFPLLKEHVNPNVTAAFFRTSELFEKLEQYLDEVIAEEITSLLISANCSELVYDIPKLRSKSAFIQEYLLYRMLKDVTKADVDFLTVKTLLHLSRSETGSSVSLTKQLTAYRDRDRLVIRRNDTAAPFHYQVKLGESHTFKEFRFSSSFVQQTEFSNDRFIEFVDADKLADRLMLRSWRDGDWFVPLGMNDKKKLSDFFIEHKVPLFQKHSIPLLESNGNIVWVCGYRLDERFKVTNQTKQIAKFEYQPHQRNN